MAKIEKGRPLPSHTKLKYDECHAKILLEKFFPEVYNDLQISDRPDLRDVVNSVGVEVTSAIPQGEQEALAIACTIPYLSKEERERKITHLKAKGYDYGKYVLSHPPRGYAWTGSDYPDIEITFCKDFLSAVKAKIKKLNSGKYAPLSRYDLLVLSEIDIEDWMPEKLLEKLISYKTEELNYSYIYLLALNGLFRFDIISREWCVRGTQADMFGLSWMARQMVEDGETDDKTQ